MDAIALFSDTWDDDLDPEVSAQLVPASAQAYLSFGKETVKGKGKAKGQGQRQGQGQISCSPVTSVIGGPSTMTERTEGKNRMSCLWSKRDIGQMIVNVQCLLPARLHKTRHAQLVWRHDNIFQLSEPGRSVFRSQRIQ